jgi:hypothetical protein
MPPTATPVTFAGGVEAEQEAGGVASEEDEFNDGEGGAAALYCQAAQRTLQRSWMLAVLALGQSASSAASS